MDHVPRLLNKNFIFAVTLSSYIPVICFVMSCSCLCHIHLLSFKTTSKSTRALQQKKKLNTRSVMWHHRLGVQIFTRWWRLSKAGFCPSMPRRVLHRRRVLASSHNYRGRHETTLATTCTLYTCSMGGQPNSCSSYDMALMTSPNVLLEHHARWWRRGSVCGIGGWDRIQLYF